VGKKVTSPPNVYSCTKAKKKTFSEDGSGGIEDSSGV